ncbi:UDP-2,4-diacetamido-2,4,6-trideoxy-beta-L-altropyranose hydrolase [Fibrisoma montanum]|uniref:UDP-2,4-diacetamido-2,4, 6-trideoxy-beta-L-altropyranose hydrolase n=1 Tax=Fibrisoma montanum TaxID=2305895 RepID=A0A418MI51_9BACT|nr:UDP-2,4-diacetamido-2,4,6-trideoxy-beta-L-altropyranose hydrolase [Fibrisoma montanum]RIV27118.1 UDP-2,4-diacetamido-2,4,6-trideoxy-beta-L-altropyranose hydrolase [Fibrisoma montanum]
MPKKILFRADGNAQIGLGHVMRCLALAEMLGDAYERRFAIVQPDPEVVRRIEEKGVTVISLPGNDVGNFLTISAPNDVAVLDGYAFDETYQRAVRTKVSKLVYIDDLVTGHQVADVLINHTGAITEYDYDAEAYTQFLLGPHYALLRSEFFADNTPPPNEGPIFVSLGGADSQNVSVNVLDALRIAFRQIGQSWRVHLVIGPFHPNRASIETYHDKLKHLTILSNLTAGQMVAEVRKCRLAITACSTIAYEVCAGNRPLIAIQTADNQSRLAHFLESEQLAHVAPAQTDVDQLAYRIEVSLLYPDSIVHTLQKQRYYFDRKTPERFRALFDRLCSPTA